MPAVVREISLVYGSITIGGTSDTYFFTDIHRLRKDQRRGVLNASVVVAPTTSAAALKTACDNIEAEFRKWNQATTLTIGGSEFISWSHSANTGMLARPSISKPGKPIDTARCRFYEIEIEVTFPADTTGDNGLREMSVDVDRTSSGVRTLRITGEYTALSGNSAVTQYEAQIATEAATITTALTGSWERVEPESYTREGKNKVVFFSRTYHEKLDEVLSHAAVFDQRLLVLTSLLSQETGPDARAPIDITVIFSCAVDKAQTQDLKALYEGTIRPYMLARARAVAPSAIWRVGDTPDYDFRENRVAARVSARCAQTNLLFQRTQRELFSTFGTVLRPIYGGNPFGRVLYRGFHRIIRVSSQQTLRLGSVERSGAGGNAGGGIFGGTQFGPGAVGGVSGGNFGAFGGVGVSRPVPADGAGGSGSRVSFGAEGYHPISARVREAPVRLGDPPDSATAYYEDREIVEEFAALVSGAGNAPPIQIGAGTSTSARNT